MPCQWGLEYVLCISCTCLRHPQENGYLGHDPKQCLMVRPCSGVRSTSSLL